MPISADTTSQETRPARPKRTDGPIRYTMVALVVAVYVALGFIFRPNANAYLLLGMPITVLFQLCVARRPLRELWLREGQPFRFDRWTAALLVVLLIGPVEAIVQGVRGSDWAVTAYGCAALLGAVGAALSFRVLGRARLRQLVILLVIAVPLALARLLAALVLAGGSRPRRRQHPRAGGRSPPVAWGPVSALLCAGGLRRRGGALPGGFRFLPAPAGKRCRLGLGSVRVHPLGSLAHAHCRVALGAGGRGAGPVPACAWPDPVVALAADREPGHARHSACDRRRRSQRDTALGRR